MGTPPAYQLEVTPVTQSDAGFPGTTVDYLLTVTNTGPNDDTYSLSSTSVWPVTFFDTLMNPITQIGPITNSGGNDDFIARVAIDGAALSGDFDIADIIATSQGDPSTSKTAQVQTNVPFATDWTENFETGSGAWTTEIIRASSNKWEIGNPMGTGPGTAYSGTNCAGTNIDNNYYADYDTWNWEPLLKYWISTPGTIFIMGAVPEMAGSWK